MCIHLRSFVTPFAPPPPPISVSHMPKADFVKGASYWLMIFFYKFRCIDYIFSWRDGFLLRKTDIFVTMVFVKVKHFYINIYSKLVGSRKKFRFTEHFVTPAFVKTTFHRINLLVYSVTGYLWQRIIFCIRTLVQYVSTRLMTDSLVLINSKGIVPLMHSIAHMSLCTLSSHTLMSKIKFVLPRLFVRKCSTNILAHWHSTFWMKTGQHNKSVPYQNEQRVMKLICGKHTIVSNASQLVALANRMLPAVIRRDCLWQQSCYFGSVR
jgi:hypothetical protein